MMKINPEVIDDLLKSKFHQNVEVAKRAYDGKFNVWQRVLNISEEYWELYWECIAVYDTKSQAETFVSTLKNRLRRNV